MLVVGHVIRVLVAVEQDLSQLDRSRGSVPAVV